MAKSPEELAELKEKINSFKAELRELSSDELKQVAGGDDESDCYGKCPKCGSRDCDAEHMGLYTNWTCRKCGNCWQTYD